VLTFAIMFVIALLISGLTLRIRAQAETARLRERSTAALYAMSRELAATRSQADLLAIARRHLEASFGAQVAILLRGPMGRVEVPPGAQPGFVPDEKERSVAQWAYDHGQAAGVGTDTLPAAQAQYLPLVASAGTVGVLGVRPLDRASLAEPGVQGLLTAFAGQSALALERGMLAERAHAEELQVEAERLRTSLLSSLSHDLRTPLAAITGAATSLLEAPGAAEPQRRELLATIRDEAQRMNRLIGNLLDMIRVETGALQVQKEWQPLEEPIGVALIRLEERLRDHPVKVSLPSDLPLVPVDAVLIEQVFVNLLENAAKYTPPGTPIEIEADVQDGAVRVSVADRGPGLPQGEEARVFDKFYRGPAGPHTTGIGLGLTICRGIIMAHGGRIWGENRPGGGAAFRFTLPLSGPQPAMPSEEVAA
jgi:two-component system sensor histidine kinase KdpD